MPASHDYTLFGDFLRKYLPSGFGTISREDPFIVDMERKLQDNGQFFYIGDLLQMKVLFTSSGCKKIIGIDPDRFDLSTFIINTKDDDRERYSRARSMVIKSGYQLLIKKSGISLLSSHFHQRNASGEYVNLLFQAYSFYSKIPHETVFTLLVLTDLSSFSISQHGYHYYLGSDRAMFRFPDVELLKVGHIYSDREFEIIKFIAAGFDSQQIADRLLLSVNTVNTHRRNILKKTRKSTTQELVIELMEKGIL